MDLGTFKKSFTPDPDKWAATRTETVVAAIWGCFTLAVIVLALYAVLHKPWLFPTSGGLFGASFALWYMTKRPEDEDIND